MLAKFQQLQRIINTGVIAVIRAESTEQAIKTVEAVKAGGIDIIEITLTVPGAIKVIEEMNSVYGNEILLGAGTVLDPETARIAMLAGAEFIVSPILNPDVVRLCNRYRKICMPGCMTVNEIIQALELGVDVVKFFPGDAYTPALIKSLKAPLPQADFIPTGGVNINNVQEWIKNGCVAVGVGGELTKGAKTGDYAAVTEQAKKFTEKVREARG